MKGNLFMISITLLIVASLVVHGIFVTDYKKQREEQEALALQIADATQTLEQLPRLPQDLEQRLAAAEANLVAEQSVFPSKVGTTQIINSILELADAYGVKAIPLASRPWLKEKVGKHEYHVFKLTIVIEGNFSQLVSFVSKLEGGGFETLVTQNLRVLRVTEQSEEGNVPEGTLPITASLDLSIYTQSIDSD